MANALKQKNTAVVWIRDGVLVDRMYINPVAFAFSSWLHLLPEYQHTPFLLEELINFGFARSGYSAKEKMELFNQERGEMIAQLPNAAADYDLIATRAALSSQFFPAVVDLLAELDGYGVLNFITSAVGQNVLDEWKKQDAKGRMIAPHLTEILGARPGFTKGPNHFAYIAETYQVDKIYYIADAVSEIATGHQYAEAYHIIPVGFAHVITRSDVMKGVDLVKAAVKQSCGIDVAKLHVDPEKLVIANKSEAESALKNAGAQKIVTDEGGGIIDSLRSYLIQMVGQ